jgi:laminin alpha 3/5
MEFDKYPTGFRVVSNFSLEFKTTESDGVLFYVADNKQVDFIALYMKEGKLVFSFNCGSGPAVLTSANTFNDGQWHSVAFWRRQWRGRLYVDGASEAEDRAKGNARSINISPPLYLGGLSEMLASVAAGNLNAITTSFKGCIRNLQLESLDFGPHDREFDIKSCSDDEETGSFFYSDGGYVISSNSFQVGMEFEVSMDIKPRSRSGVLFSVSSSSGFFLIQMVDGEIIASASNGGAVIKVEKRPINSLCNGQWHNVRAKKDKAILSLVVDNNPAFPGIGESEIFIDTYDPAYIGGLPTSYQGVQTSAQYVGCIREVRVNGVLQNLEDGTIYGRVTSTCPTT